MNMIRFSALSYSLIIFIVILNTCFALECYVCDNQEDNNGKCVTTIKTCDYGEDVCLTEIKWGSRPYWFQGALKQYYISKRCSTKDKCARYRKSNMDLCTHVMYLDWKCSECCKGDRCNYYVISTSTNLKMGGLVLWTSILLSFTYLFIRF